MPMRLLLIAPLFVALMLITLVNPSSAQVATGIPAFSSIGGGPVDKINLGNLNVHLDIPIRHKAGRGLAFDYILSYDSLVWTPVGVSGQKSWQPTQNWGWSSNWGGTSGYITYAGSSTTCLDNNGHPDGEISYWTNWTYHDPWTNASHPFSGQIVIYSGGQNCTGTNVYSFSSTATDNSGMTLNANVQGTTTVTTKSGTVLSPPLSMPVGSVSSGRTDSNGNSVSSDTSGNFTDTLGVKALSISGTNPVSFSYNDANGSARSFSLAYSSYSVKTNFGCSGISEYTASGISLVSSLTLPDGSKYAFTYEATPGSSGYVTGRPAKVTLPTGGTITYAYTGGSNGVVCADGSTSGLTRTTTDGGWTYTRSGSGNTWTTTVSDASSPANQTVIAFEKDANTSAPTYNFYETQRQVYQGSKSTGTLLLTRLGCYNANFASCSTAAVSSPISQTDQYQEIPSGKNSLVETKYNNFGLITETKRYDYGVAIGSAPSTSPVSDTVIAYASLGNGIQNRPASIIVKDGTGAVKAKTTYSYDQTAITATSGTPQHGAVSGSRGNLTTIAYQVNGSTTLYRSNSRCWTGTGGTCLCAKGQTWCNIITGTAGSRPIYPFSSK